MQFSNQIRKVKFLLFLFFISILPLNIFCMEQKGQVCLLICMDAEKAERLASPLFDLANNLKSIFSEKAGKMSQYQAQASLGFDPLNVSMYEPEKMSPAKKFADYASSQGLGNVVRLVSDEDRFIKEEGKPAQKLDKVSSRGINISGEISKVKGKEIVILSDGDWYSSVIGVRGVTYSVILMNPQVTDEEFRGTGVKHRIYNFYSTASSQKIRIERDFGHNKLINIESLYEQKNEKTLPIDFSEEFYPKIFKAIPEVIFNIDKMYKESADLRSVLFSLRNEKDYPKIEKAEDVILKIFTAIQEKNTQAALDILQKSSGIDVNKKIQGRTLLHEAVITNNLPIVKLLIEKYRANVNAKTDKSGSTPLDSAISYSQVDPRYFLIFDYLKSKGAEFSENFRARGEALLEALLKDAENSTIKTEQASSNVYILLGVTTGNPKDIKKAFLRLAVKCHPDKNPNNQKLAEEAMKVLNGINLNSSYDTKSVPFIVYKFIVQKREELKNEELKKEKEHVSSSSSSTD